MENNNNSNHQNEEHSSTSSSTNTSTLQSSNLNHETPDHNNNNNASGMSLISSDRQYSVGMGKDQQPNSRLWVDTADDPTMVHLYCLEQSDDDKEVYVCGHCKQYNRITAVEILHPEGGTTELWEHRTHFVSCTRNKLDVEKYLLGFEKPIPIPPRQPPRKVQPRRSRADTPPSRSRSRSPLQSPATTTATPASASTSANNTPGEYRGRKPNLQAMSIIPKTHWRLKNAENGVVDVDTKLFIFTHPNKSIGREYSYGVTFDGGVLFYCDNCLFLTRERQKRKAFYKVIRGKVIIREANHYATCRPSELRHVCDASSAENNDAFVPAVAGGDEDDVSMEDERSYDSQEPETTIEYDSTTAPSPDIPEPPPPQPPKPTPRVRSRTLKSKQTPAASAKIPPSNAPTFRPVFDSETPISGGTAAAAANKQRDRLPPPTRRYSSNAAAPATAAPSVQVTSTPIYLPVQQQPTPSAAAAPASIATPSRQPIVTLQRPLPTNVPAEFQPYLLPADRTLIYNTPSSGQMREIATKFGFPFSYKCYQFWSSTLSTISEINGSSKVAHTHPISPIANEFSCLSLFLTGAEEYGKQIQEGIKEYFCNQYFTDDGFTLPRDIIQHSLITNAITDIHLHILSKMISCSIAVFNGSKIEIFGLTTDETTPFMLLKKTDTKYEPVLGISN